MFTDIFLCLVIISPWPIIYSFVLHYSCKYTKFKFIIYTKRQLYVYLIYLLGYLLFFNYIFFTRLIGQHRRLNLSKMYEILFTWLNDILITYGMSSLVLGSLFVMFWIIWFILLVRWLVLFLKKLILALYLYFYQYKFFFTLLRKGSDILVNIRFFLSFSLNLNLKNFLVDFIQRYIWPWFFFALEKYIYRYLLLYLWIFDVMTNYGNISKVFFVLPWYYIYSLLRAFRKYMKIIDNRENWKISDNAYGFWRSIITGEELLNPPQKLAGHLKLKGGIRRFLKKFKIIK